MTFLRSFTALSFASLVLSSCGSDDSKKSETPLTVKASVTLANALGAGNAHSGVQEYTSATCSKQSTGLFEASFSATNGAKLTFKIKGFKGSTAASYTCEQAENNKLSTTSIGDKYDTCGVEVASLTSASTTTLDTFSTFRDEISIEPFTYVGACSISVTAVTDTSAKGTVSCTKMVETRLKNNVRNPLDKDVTVDASGSFECSF